MPKGGRVQPSEVYPHYDDENQYADRYEILPLYTEEEIDILEKLGFDERKIDKFIEMEVPYDYLIEIYIYSALDDFDYEIDDIEEFANSKDTDKKYEDYWHTKYGAYSFSRSIIAGETYNRIISRNQGRGLKQTKGKKMKSRKVKSRKMKSRKVKSKTQKRRR